MKKSLLKVPAVNEDGSSQNAGQSLTRLKNVRSLEKELTVSLWKKKKRKEADSEYVATHNDYVCVCVCVTLKRKWHKRRLWAWRKEKHKHSKRPIASVDHYHSDRRKRESGHLNLSMCACVCVCVCVCANKTSRWQVATYSCKQKTTKNNNKRAKTIKINTSDNSPWVVPHRTTVETEPLHCHQIAEHKLGSSPISASGAPENKVPSSPACCSSQTQKKRLFFKNLWAPSVQCRHWSRHME